MELSAERARVVLLCAFGLGLLGDLLLHGVRWGAGFSVWTAVVALVAFLLTRRFGGRLSLGAAALLLAAALLAAFVAVRDSRVLLLLNVWAAAAAFLFAALDRPGSPVHRATLSELTAALAGGALSSIIGSIPLAGQARRGENPLAAQAGAWGRGILITVPAVFFFGLLLLSADAAYEHLVVDVVASGLRPFFNHLLFTILLAALLAGLLRRHLLAGSRREPAGTRSYLVLGVQEVGMMLAALALLFSSFIAVQASYFFGGVQTLLSTPGLSAAEYARRGFFELVVVVAVAVPTLLAAMWLFSEKRPWERWVVHGLAGLNLLLLYALMASAVWRLLLYSEAFGLTESRLYAGAFLGWLGIVLLLLAIFVLGAASRGLAYACVMTAFAGLVLLNLVNPDGFIAATNLSRAAEGKPIDVDYNARLSDDALPQLVDGLSVLPLDEERELAFLLRSRLERGEGDWRSWNLARARVPALVGQLSSP